MGLPLTQSRRDFWTEVRKMSSKTVGTSVIVDGISEPNGIAELFANKYQSLYSSVSYTLCPKKSDAKIQITITTAHLIRIKYSPTSLNHHLSNVNVANFNKIDHTVYKQQLF